MINGKKRSSTSTHLPLDQSPIANYYPHEDCNFGLHQAGQHSQQQCNSATAALQALFCHLFRPWVVQAVVQVVCASTNAEYIVIQVVTIVDTKSQIDLISSRSEASTFTCLFQITVVDSKTKTIHSMIIHSLLLNVTKNSTYTS